MEVLVVLLDSVLCRVAKRQQGNKPDDDDHHNQHLCVVHCVFFFFAKYASSLAWVLGESLKASGLLLYAMAMTASQGLPNSRRLVPGSGVTSPPALGTERESD